MSETTQTDNLVVLAADVVAAYVSNNIVALADMPSLIAQVHKALASTTAPIVAEPVGAPVPAVSIRKSIQPDFIVCLEDGKKFKSLKRHLRMKYDMSPEEYRIKWGLPADYPMVAPNYAAVRSQLAKSIGLGQQRKKSPVAAPEPVKKGRKAKR